MKVTVKRTVKVGKPLAAKAGGVKKMMNPGNKSGMSKTKPC